MQFVFVKLASGAILNFSRLITEHFYRLEKQMHRFGDGMCDDARVFSFIGSY